MGCGLSKAHSNPEVLVSHGSARLTFHGRRLIVQRHQAGWPQAHIAAAMGVSRKCVKTWIDRYATEGDAGLVTRSSRPHTMPTKTSEELEQKVLAARSTLREGPDVLGPRVGVPREAAPGSGGADRLRRAARRCRTRGRRRCPRRWAGPPQRPPAAARSLRAESPRAAGLRAGCSLEPSKRGV